MKIFVINLKRSTERRTAIEKQLIELGLDYKIIEAIDGSELSSVDLARDTKQLNYAFKCGEIGCALSHIKIYNQMVNEQIKSALILEDDININPCLEDIIHNLHIPSVKPTVILLSRVNKYFKKPIATVTNNYTLHKTQHATTTHSYVLNIQAAKALIKNLYPVWMVADKWSLFEDMSIVNVFNIIPHPISLSENAQKSTINTNKANNNFDEFKKVMWEILMDKRPIKAKFNHKFRRAITPLFKEIVNQGKG